MFHSVKRNNYLVFIIFFLILVVKSNICDCTSYLNFGIFLPFRNAPISPIYTSFDNPGDILEETAFSLSLRSDKHLHDRTDYNLINEWTKSAYSHFSTWSVFEFGEEGFQTPYPGVYLLSGKTSQLSHPGILIRNPIWRSKNLRIHLKSLSGVNLENLVFRS